MVGVLKIKIEREDGWRWLGEVPTGVQDVRPRAA
jgi:hypothetical protein